MIPIALAAFLLASQAEVTIDRVDPDRRAYFAAFARCLEGEALIESDPKEAIRIIDGVIGDPRVQQNECRLRIQETAATYTEWREFYPYQLRGRARMALARRSGPGEARAVLEAAVLDLETSVQKGVHSSTAFLKAAREAAAPAPVDLGPAAPALPFDSGLAALAQGKQDSGFKIPARDFTLPNGMRFLVVERHDVPRVFCSLWWRVGSVHERPGVTGLSHFFEHMMFMGTDVIGTTDAKKDAELNAKIEEVMGLIREIKIGRLEAERRGAPPDPELEEGYKGLWKKYEKLVEEQKKTIIPEHLSKIFQANGGTGLNATTSYDRTNFFVDMPANKVELFCWLESDRFLKPVFRSFYPEREVVKEERRMRTDSTPTGLIRESFSAMFWQSHPYKWPVIGWMSDIDQYTMADAERYYRTHYSPENCTAIFVGDVRFDELKGLCERYFGRLKRSPVERDAIVTVEPEQVAERRMVAEANAQDDFSIHWHGPSGVHRDTALCDLLMNVFSGRSGRLYRPLVEEKKLALEVQAGYESRRYGGSIMIDATPREGADVAELEKAIGAIVEDVRKNGVTERELAKARNQQLADLVRMLKTSQGVTHQLGYFETIGTFQDFDAYVRSVEAATAADLKRVAEQYLKPTGRNILVIKRKEKKK